MSLNPSPSPERRLAQALVEWNDGDSRLRRTALRQFARLGPRAAQAVPALIAGLTDTDSKIRTRTATALARIGGAAAAATSAITAALEDSNQDVREAAADALACIKPDPRAVVPALVASLQGKPDRWCNTVSCTLAALGEPVVPALVDLLESRDARVRRVAVGALERIGPRAKSAIPSLIKALAVSEPSDDAWPVASALGAMGAEALDALLVALAHQDAKVSEGAAIALGRLGPQAEAAIPALIAALAEREPPNEPVPPRGPKFGDPTVAPQPTVYQRALRAIGRPATLALVERLDRGDRQTRALAVRALGFMQWGTKVAVPRLIELLKDPDLRIEAATALGDLDSPAQKAIPSLLLGLKDPDPAFRARAAETVGRIAGLSWARDAVGLLTAALDDSDPRVRACAAGALGDFWFESRPAIPRLVAAFDDPAADVRLAAIRAFQRVGKIPAASRDAVLRLLQDPDARVRRSALQRIEDDDLDSETVVEALVAALRDPDSEVRAAAATALGRAHVWSSSDEDRPRYQVRARLPRPPSAAAILRAALDDPDARVRAAAADLLPVFDDLNDRTLPLLRDKLHDPDAAVRSAAALGLVQLGAAAKPAVPDLLQALDDPEMYTLRGGVCVNAARALMEIDGPDEPIRHFAARLTDPDKRRRELAVSSLWEIAQPILPTMERCLCDAEVPRSTKIAALATLCDHVHPGSIQGADQARGLVSLVRDAVHDDDPDVRANARMLLFQIETGGAVAAQLVLDAAREESVFDWEFDAVMDRLELPAAGVLLHGLTDLDEDVRTTSAYALAAVVGKTPRHGEEPDPDDSGASKRKLPLRPEIADALILALDDPDTQVRWAAAWGLYVLRTGERAVSALIDMAKDRTTRVRTGALIRLASVLGGTNWQRFERSAHGEPLRIAAFQALAGFGPAAAPAVPILIDALKDTDPLTQWYAAGALAEIGAHAHDAAPGLVDLLQSKDEVDTSLVAVCGPEAAPTPLGVIAAKALGRIGPGAGAAASALAEALAHPNVELRREAAEALGVIGPAPARAASALARALDDHDFCVAQNAEEALGRIGARAVASLGEALRSRLADVRLRAIAALGRIGPEASAALAELHGSLADPDDEIRTAAAEAIAAIGKST
jgi:HEAT repeat protein